MSLEAYRRVVAHHEAGHLVAMLLLDLPIVRFVWLEGNAAHVEPGSAGDDLKSLYKLLVAKASSRPSQSMCEDNGTDSDAEAFHDDDAQIQGLLGMAYDGCRAQAESTGGRVCSRNRFKLAAEAYVRADAELLFSQAAAIELVAELADRLVATEGEIPGAEIEVWFVTRRQDLESLMGAIVTPQVWDAFSDFYLSGGIPPKP